MRNSKKRHIIKEDRIKQKEALIKRKAHYALTNADKLYEKIKHSRILPRFTYVRRPDAFRESTYNARRYRKRPSA